jgi:Family of unknown function (DUF5302)
MAARFTGPESAPALAGVPGWAGTGRRQEAVMAETASGPAEAEDEAGPEDEARRKFREALDRKRAREAEASAAGQGHGTGKIHGAHGPARQRRSFRRKSG